MRNRMQRLETPSLEAFAKICLSMCGTIRTPMHYGRGICVLHEGTKSEREERYHLVMKKLNSFLMLPK